MKNSGPIRVTADQVDAYNAKQRANRIERARQKPKKRATVSRPGEMGERQCKNIVDYRSQGACELHIASDCTGRGLDHHHLKLRSQGGRWLPSRIVHCCRRCHRAVTNTNGWRAQYERNGWLIPSWVDDHAPVPFLRSRREGDEWVREWVYLDNSGGTKPATDTHDSRGNAA